MDLLWLPIAFVFGFVARQIGLPPLVGFLAAGFALNGLDYEAGDAIGFASDLGVTVLLFTVGLKLKVRTMLRPQIWAVASIHAVATTVLFGGGILLVAGAGLSIFAGLEIGTAMLIGFALSFSSTVFVVKLLEDRSEMSSAHGRVAIGVLVMQDLFAVLFIAISYGRIPSPWAIALLGLLAVRPLLVLLTKRAGHGELLVLCGLVIAIGTYKLFELVDVKGDLGALLIGALLAGTPRADELAKSLLSLKDLLLVGFFLEIGLEGLPTLESAGVAALLAVAMPLKVLGFLWLLTRFRMRARTSQKAAFNLANYSEFGLIVGLAGYQSGWLSADWLIAIALALAATFVIASVLNTYCDTVFARFADRLRALESPHRLPEDALIEVNDARIAIFGMGRIGSAAYDEVTARLGNVVIGLDANEDTVARQQASGRRVTLGDATDPELYARLEGGDVQLILLTMPNHKEVLRAAAMVSEHDESIDIAAVVRYPDEVATLHEAGIKHVYDIFGRAGAGFAATVCETHGTDEMETS